MKDDLVIYANGSIRSKTGVLLSLVLPLMFILLFGAIFSGAGISGGALSMGSARPTVYIQNRDSGNMSQAFIQALDRANATDNVMVDNSQDLAQYLLSHSVSDGIMIPSNFSPDYWSKTPVNVTVYGNPASPTSAIISGVVASVLNAFNLQRAGGTPVVSVSQLPIRSQSFKYIDFLVPGLIGYAILANPIAMVNMSSQYKRDKIFKQLSLTPLTKAEWLLSKNLWFMGLTMISFLVMVACGVYVFGAYFALSPALIAFLLLGTFLFVSLGMLIGSATNSVESAGLITNLVVFPMMFLSGTFFPLAAMPQYLQFIARVFPLYYVIDGLNNVMIYSNMSQALLDIGILAIISAVVFVSAIKFFKWRED